METWARARLALALLCVDPVGLTGLWLRARSGPVRDTFLEGLGALPLPRRKLHPGIGDDALFGGVDLAATLSAGDIRRTRGLLDTPSALILTMAERATPALGARLAQALDGGTHCLVALDESADEDEGLPSALTDRLGLFVALDNVAIGDTEIETEWDIEVARARLSRIIIPADAIAALTTTAASLGIDSLRAPRLALAAARAHSALWGRDIVSDEDLSMAATLVYGHRATIVPAGTPEEDEPPPPEPDRPDDSVEEETQQQDGIPDELLIEAARAALPPELLARLAAGRATRMSKTSSGTGAAQKGNRRGRPLPSRPGKLDGQSRIDLIATLRAAAPWQTVRQAMSPRGQGLHIRPSDIRVKRYESKSDRLLIFTVDASGSAAMARLAEAKGAVELLLAQAYSRRDHVALISFRGTGAELLLPPTRSLVQTKRRLAGLPGGGGTPLASGLQVALELAMQARARGMTPTVAVLTDGRANVGLDGQPGRAQAAEDASRLARSLRGQGIAGLLIDTGNRPAPTLGQLAAEMDAIYLPLPRADADRLSRAVGAALD
ncbi:magnesium chelatase subunit D [Anianabacter salinae]|uniref:magnesium chelatase subunit D n=1 Tax=Anianabacter salinae TaxID=2851023 RepID=UPI00225E0AED|nr:magnesium chelatase subunit D [Anianabacter salinae]MBV0914130.1 magnesium chelatase subunit D [Anianabacter salinae]